MKIETVWQELQARSSLTLEDKQWLYCRFYDIYNQGLEDGRQEIKNKLISNFVKQLEAE